MRAGHFVQPSTLNTTVLGMQWVAEGASYWALTWRCFLLGGLPPHRSLLLSPGASPEPLYWTSLPPHTHLHPRVLNPGSDSLHLGSRDSLGILGPLGALTLME